MLKMSTNFEDYQQRNNCNRSIATSPSSDGCSVDWAAHSGGGGGCGGSSGKGSERESIHSGQFMVSHFEAEEAQDDLEDGEVKMLDPEDPSLSKPDEPPVCTQVQLYVPRMVASKHAGGGDYASAGLITSHLEIETSLTKLFKCMNLAYSQKLTSPKWNHFKGVRLRWKDKIRLNNVIWRCWHMQFIQKRRTPVCQFASPLDVDIHSNPQSVVLEGKYWKRQLVVIKAEYRKWRRNFKSNAIGCLTYDNKSELDFLEWSPINDRGLVLSSEDWTSDTLFSAINVPFPFPDPREIARGAGIADFIQPSLGPLQPNLDDIDITFAELLQNHRLPPVPEEATDEMLKSVDYGLSAILGAEQIDAHNISMQSDNDTNMMELNTPVSAVPYADIEQQFAVARGAGGVGGNIPANLLGDNQAAAGVAEIIANAAANMLANERSNAAAQQNNRNAMKQSTTTTEGLLLRQSLDFTGKSVIKGRVSKPSQRPFRREPHNYDKAQPTLHQTTIYQQFIAEQQLQSNLSNNLQMQASPYAQQQAQQQQQQQQQQQHQQQQQQQQQQQHQQQQLQYANSQYVLGVGSSNNNNTANYGGLLGTSPATNNMVDVSAKNYGLAVQAMTGGGKQTTQPLLLNVKLEPSSSDVLSLYGGMANVNDAGGNAYGSNNNVNNMGATNNNAYKPYPNVANFTKSSSTGNYINMRGSGTSINQQQQSFAHDQSTPNLHISTQSLGPLLGGGGGATLQLQQQQQQQRLPYPQQQQTQAQLSPVSSQQQQQQHQQQQQQQQQQLLGTTTQQQQQHGAGMLPKEMFRSNSLPLNVSFQKLEARGSQDNNFAIPKQHMPNNNSNTNGGNNNNNNNKKNSKSRTRSNSIHHHQHAVPVTPTNGGSGSVTNLTHLTQQLQAANSDPMLNSTLAQLLTTNQRMSTLAKQQSSSTSAISTLNVTMPPGNNAHRRQSTTATITASYLSPGSSGGASTIVGGAAGTGGTTADHLQRQQLHQHQHHQQQQQQQQQLQKSPKKSNSLPTPVAPQMLPSPQGNKVVSFPLTSPVASTATTSSAAVAAAAAAVATQLSLSPESFHDIDSPLSPTHNVKYPRDSQRRAGHIHAEQKRRYNIKNGFDMLHSLIPQLQQNPNAKLSKAAMLQKGAEYIKHLRNERNQLNDNMDQLRKERDTLSNSLTHLHSKLPANGAPVTRQGTEHVRQLYEQYVQYRTMNNWKFWILGLILEPLLSSYTASVSSASQEELRRTAYLWIDQHCSLIDLRPAVSNKLKYLSMKTDILSDPPSTLQEEVAKAVNNTNGQHPNLHDGT